MRTSVQNLLHHLKHVLAHIVSQREMEFTASEIAAARQARDLNKTLGYPSPHAAAEIVLSGTLINCPLTANDIAPANEIYGPEVRSQQQFRPRDLSLETATAREII